LLAEDYGEVYYFKEEISGISVFGNVSSGPSEKKDILLICCDFGYDGVGLIGDSNICLILQLIDLFGSKHPNSRTGTQSLSTQLFLLN
jgi:hypothetical protein